MSDFDDSRRAFVRKAVYVAPAIVTLAAAPAYARLGSDPRAAGPQTTTPSAAAGGGGTASA